MRRDQYLGMTDYLNSDDDDVPMDETDLSGFMSTSSMGFADTPPKVVTRARPSSASAPSPISQDLGVSLLSDEEGIWSPISPWYAHTDTLGHPYLAIAAKMAGGVGMIYYTSQLALSKRSGVSNPGHKKGLAISTGLYFQPMLGWNHGLLQTAGGNRFDNPNAWWWSAAKLAILSTGAYTFFYVPLTRN